MKVQLSNAGKCLFCPAFLSYAIENEICCLCLCDKNLPAKFCFAFLEDLAKEFNNRYGPRIHSVTRPYHFIEFEYVKINGKALEEEKSDKKEKAGKGKHQGREKK
uniref:Longin domain-containing protein n=1 Tax=Romanomermis culicivorax TaxID=13658 RepID=A0A915K0E9_ROMCU